MSSITGDFIASNKISIEKYLLDEHLESYLKTKTRSAVSVCIDYIHGLILLPKRKNMSKMAIYCCKCSNNQSLSHFISNSPWPSTNLLKFDELAKMQSSRYWIERAFQDAKGYCGMSEYMVRSWNAWHHHMALVMLAMLILLSYKIKFMRFHNISLHGVFSFRLLVSMQF